MATMLALGIAFGLCLGAVLWEVLFCNPLRRDNEELRIHITRKGLRAAGDRMGYVEYRLQHRGTPYIPTDGETPTGYITAPGPWRFVPLDEGDHSKSAELRVV